MKTRAVRNINTFRTRSSCKYGKGVSLISPSPSVWTQSGATIVEVALSLAPVMFLILFFIQCTVMMFHLLSIQYVANRAARWMSVNGGGTLNTNREKLVEDFIGASSLALGIDPDKLSIKICPVSSPNCSVNDSAGGNQFVLLSIEKTEHIFTQQLPINIKAQAVVKNEPF